MGPLISDALILRQSIELVMGFKFLEIWTQFHDKIVAVDVKSLVAIVNISIPKF